jgi:hypothetical protein
MPFRRTLQVAGLVALALSAPGCATMNNTEKGLLGGAALGGVGGALVGSAVGHPGAGAAIGAGLGGVGGGLIGNAVDKSEARQEARLAAATAPGPLGLTDVAQMAQQHVSDDLIVGQIRATGAVYNLSATDVVWLKQNGVSDRVIQEMQLTARRPVGRVCPVPVYEPVYVLEPPPPALRVGFGYHHHHHHRCWR